MKSLSRRAFLAALGAASAFCMADSPARAGRAKGAPTKDLERPLRFIGIYTPHGRAHELWAPRAGFRIAYEGSILAPFDDAATYGKSFKDKLVVIDGVNLSAGIAVGTTGHDAARVILTGSGADGKNPSIDQFLAIDQGLGIRTLYSSLALGVGQEGTELGQNISYAPGGTPIPKWIDPSVTFAELFGRHLGVSSPDLALRRKQGRSILDLVRGDLRRLEARAPASEKLKLEQHGAALRDIEKRLTMTAPACDVPAAPQKLPAVKSFAGGEKHFDAITDLQIDLLARALACDLTRFATLYLGDLSRGGLIPGYPNDVHTDVAHRYDARTDKHPGTPETWQRLAVQNRYSMSKVARLLSALDRAGVLDDTLVYVSSDMGDTARHTSRHVPTLLAGGAGGALKMGQHLDLRGKNDGIPNNRLLVSIANAFGVNVTSYGHAASSDITHGRLDELHRAG